MKNTLIYKGFIGSVHFSADDGVFHGRLEGIDDLVTFEGRSVDELLEAFHEEVDAYLSLCKKLGKEPLKSYKGSFNVRIAPSSSNWLGGACLQGRWGKRWIMAKIEDFEKLRGGKLMNLEGNKKASKANSAFRRLENAALAANAAQRLAEIPTVFHRVDAAATSAVSRIESVTLAASAAQRHIESLRLTADIARVDSRLISEISLIQNSLAHLQSIPSLSEAARYVSGTERLIASMNSRNASGWKSGLFSPFRMVSYPDKFFLFDRTYTFGIT